jgi:hypothetical protein
MITMCRSEQEVIFKEQHCRTGRFRVMIGEGFKIGHNLDPSVVTVGTKRRLQPAKPQDFASVNQHSAKQMEKAILAFA